MKLKYMSVAIAAMFVGAGSVSAQQTAPTSPAGAKADDSEKIETVTVTARRREELIQDVPGAVTAFSGAAIEKAGIPDVTGLADFVPNTMLKTSRATNTTARTPTRTA